MLEYRLEARIIGVSLNLTNVTIPIRLTTTPIKDTVNCIIMTFPVRCRYVSL